MCNPVKSLSPSRGRRSEKGCVNQANRRKIDRSHRLGKAALARWNGTAPIPVWTGNDDRYRLNRGGDRQVNSALHRIAITQWRGAGGAGRYESRRFNLPDPGRFFTEPVRAQISPASDPLRASVHAAAMRPAATSREM